MKKCYIYTNAVQNAAETTIDEEQVAKFEEATFAHMKLEEGYDPHEMIGEVQACITPVKYNCIREDGRLHEAIDRLVDIRTNKLPKMKAVDFHDNKICLEIEAMAETGEMMMRSALLRKESRGSHIREDYVEKDNENWLKWIIIENKDGKMEFSTKDVPIDSYKYRPDNA